ncbi:MAG: leucyl aminopeptidase family protein [Flavipsychrobacter sp.]
MNFKVLQKAPKKHHLYIVDNADAVSQATELSKEEIAHCQQSLKNNSSTVVTINQLNKYIFVYQINRDNEIKDRETCRKKGAELQTYFNALKLDDVAITNLSGAAHAPYTLSEGIALANYNFLKYKKDAAKLASSLKSISFTKGSVTPADVKELSITCEAIYRMRDLINEPLSYLTAPQLAKEIAKLGKESGFKVTTLNKAQIVKLKMGGLLAVNRGSLTPPTFTIMEHKPRKVVNKQPIVLVGKGVVYDTGGLSLKPTAGSMDRMKSDMSGSALVSGAMYAIAKMQLPIHVIALVPATDNRPGQDAYAPGDVITMHSGSTVEVLNTDAEGRMLLADALHYAKKYKPELVFDFATLTGAAAIAVGQHGIVCMGTASDETKAALKESGNNEYERLVEYPLWDEYGDQLHSEIADMKNIGGREGGAITAGKFLEHFTDYPWMHFDIAGVSFNPTKSGYKTAGGSGMGLRMLLDFLTNYSKG